MALIAHHSFLSLLLFVHKAALLSLWLTDNEIQSISFIPDRAHAVLITLTCHGQTRTVRLTLAKPIAKVSLLYHAPLSVSLLISVTAVPLKRYCLSSTVIVAY